MTERENYVELLDDSDAGDILRRVKNIRVNGKPVTVAADGVRLSMEGDVPVVTLTIMPSELIIKKEQ